MEENLGNHRRSYEKYEMRRENMAEHPMVQFQNWFNEIDADKNTIFEANAMTLSTIGSDGFPKNRIVLLKNFTEKGFVFYTNYDSEKSRAILKNPNVCLSFFWSNWERQVIIKGLADKISTEISDEYFNSRPKESQWSAIVSPQSSVVPNREFLEKKLKNLMEESSRKEPVRPDFWGGFLVKPVSIEFWQGRKNRLHDRFRYTSNNSTWEIERLAP